MDASKGPGGARGRSGAGEGASRNAGSRLTKVGSEISRLATDVEAIHWSSAILVRVDEAKMDYLRALLTGPADTPYANGVFLFDIGLPPEFPELNPAVQFLTTGGGTVRFNPNLVRQVLCPLPLQSLFSRTPTCYTHMCSTPTARCACRCSERGRAPSGCRA
jgi:baculoviral IAP repeat-containing protein 6